jgi:hypothetical protein
MPKILAMALVMCFAGTAWAAGAQVYPGARVETAETGHFQEVKTKSSPALQAQIGHRTFYTTPDAFDKVYAFYKKLYPETDLNIKKINAPLANNGKLNEAYFCLDGAPTVGQSRNWIKLQHPFISTSASQGTNYRPKIEQVTVIITTVK